MPITQITVTGTITLASTMKPLADLRIEIWDSTKEGLGWLSSGYTDDAGIYKVLVNDPAATQIASGAINAKYKIFKGKNFLNEEEITGSLVDDVLTVDIDIKDYLIDDVYDEVPDPKPDEEVSPFIKMNGQVTDSLGVPLVNMKVNIFETVFRNTQLVASGLTNADGKYFITVHAKNVNNSTIRGKKVIKIEVRDSADSLAAQSENIVIGGDTISIDLKTETVDTQTEFDKMSVAIQAIIDAESIEIDEIDEENDEVSYIAKVLSIKENTVRSVVKARKLAAGSSMPADIIYALMKEKGAHNDSLYYSKESVDAGTIAKAIEKNIISSYSETEITNFYANAVAGKVQTTKDAPIKDEVYVLNDILLSIVPGADTPEKQANIDDFLALYMQEHDSLDDFWAAYTAANDDNPAFTEKLKLGLKVSAVTHFQPQITNKIITDLGSDDISKVARWDLDTWKTKIGAVCTEESTLCVPAKMRGEETDPENTDIHEAYANRLMSISKALYPLSSVAGVLEGYSGGDIIADSGIRAHVVAFIDNNLSFDLRVHSVHEINEEDFDIPSGATVDDIKTALEPVQRVMRIVGGNPDAVCALLAAGVTSSKAIADMRYEEFVDTFGDLFPPDETTSEIEPSISPMVSSIASMSNLSNSVTQVYNNAQLVNTTTNNLLTNYTTAAANTNGAGNTAQGLESRNVVMTAGKSLPAMPPVFHGGFTSSPTDNPVLSELFGSIDFCSCCDCKSVVSPAAYLSDMLNFLKTDAPNVYAQLQAKRPDIINIDLTCKNTDTPLPYIDLVIELLELQVLKSSAATYLPPTHLVGSTPTVDFNKFSFQTSGTSKQLAAYGERTYKDTAGVYKDYTEYNSGNAYNWLYGTNNLANAVYPSELPFNMAIEESRVYLSHFGRSRYDLMKLFTPVNQTAVANSVTPPTDKITDFSVCAEYLGISVISAAIITGKHEFSASPYYYYGSSGTTASFTDPNDSDTILTGNWQDVLSDRIDVLLQQTRITYSELLQYLSTDYLNPVLMSPPVTRYASIVSRPDAPSVTTCKLDKLKLEFNSTDFRNTFYNKFYRFIRLVKASKLSIYQWDILLRSMNITDITNENFQQLVKVLMLAEELSIEPEIMACWWNYIDVQTYLDFPNSTNEALPSVYANVFNNSGVINNKLYNYFADSNIPPTTKLVMTVSGAVVSLLPEIANFCGLTESELKTLLTYYSISESNFSTTTVTVNLLSRLYILSVLAKGWKMKIDELVKLMRHCDNLFTSPATTAILDNANTSTRPMSIYISRLVLLMDTVKAINKSKFKVGELNFLFADSNPDSALAPNITKIEAFYSALRQDMNKVEKIPADGDTVYKNQLKNIVYQNLSKEFGISLEWVRDILRDCSDTTVTDLVNDVYFITSSYNLSEPNVNYIDSLSSVASGASLTVSSIAHPSNNNNVKPAFSLPKLYTLYRYFNKVSFITKRLKIRKDDFLYFLNYGSLAIVFEFKKMPVSGTLCITGAAYEQPIVALNGFLRLCRALELTGRLKLDDGKIGKLLDAARGVKYSPLSAIAYSQTRVGVAPGSPVTTLGDKTLCLTTWTSFFVHTESDLVSTFDTEAIHIRELVGNSVLSTDYTSSTVGVSPLLNVKFSTTPDNSNFNGTKYQNLSMAFDIIEILAACKKVGLAPSILYKMLLENVTLRDTRNLIIAAKGKYSDDAWAKVAKPLRDRIRVRQRDVLVAYINVHPNVLYSNLLIDTQMDACMMTSRIKQAISSVQLLVDRVILGLEYTLTSPSQIVIQHYVADQWSRWRKWYVIWQANRKVFLFPENWMEPELRDDRSQLFKEFEAQLKQDELTSEKAEEAINVYLHKLHEIGKLEPVGTCDENVNGVIVTHVISRTYNTRKYFHRMLCNGIWSSWTRIDIDIKSDHVMPTIKDGRLHLFWLTFVEKQAFHGYVATPMDINSFWFYNPQDKLVSDSHDTDTNKYTHMTVILNWCEFRDNKWQNVNIGNDKMVLKVSHILPTILNELIPRNTSDIERTYNFTFKTFELSLTDLVRSKIYFIPMTETNGDFSVKLYFSQTNVTPSNKTIRFGVLRPNEKGMLSKSGNPEPYATFLHGFKFKVGQPFPEVIKSGVEAYNVGNFNLPMCTLLNNMKFYENNLGYNGAAFADRSLSAFTQFSLLSSSQNLYNYVSESIGSTSIYVGSGEKKILRSTATNGVFRITLKTPTRPEFGADPLIDKFFFEDNINTFFVQKAEKNYTVSPFYTIGINGANEIAGGFYATVTSGSGSGLTDTIQNVQNVRNTGEGAPADTRKFLFHTFYHPYTVDFIKNIDTAGLIGLYRPDLLSGLKKLQYVGDDMNFIGTYNVDTNVNTGIVFTDAVLKPKRIVDFDYRGAYSSYNWEVFYHIPMLVAQRLSEDQKFSEAQKWYHFIFDPTAPGNTRQRFWKCKPLFDLAAAQIDTIDDLVQKISSSSPEAKAQIAQSNSNPFQPYMIARVRQLAFMNNTIMKYLDNLIAWGDNLFSRDTIESINEATQLYIMAANILGRKPVSVPQRATTATYTFRQLSEGGGVNALGSASVAIESFVAPNFRPSNPSVSVAPGVQFTKGNTKQQDIFRGEMAYFCVTPNDKLLSYWDKIADRLFKIRHCQNISGIERQLPLFEPPIDPALLVQATAAGLDMESVINDITGINTPNYRFTYMLQKANEFCADVKSLGGSLLSALEKKDAEALALLRQNHEINVLNAVLQVKKTQVDEAVANLESVMRTKDTISARWKYYSTRKYMNGSEEAYFTSLKVAMALNIAQTAVQAAASISYAFPDAFVGPMPLVGHGGTHVGNMLGQIAGTLGAGATINSTVGAMASMKGTHDRRMDDWIFQAGSAQLELEQVDKQILAAQIRVNIAEQEYKNQELQISNTQDIDTFMRSKFTNEELYDWMVGQISATYFQSYQLALKMSKKAEYCYKKELPISETTRPQTFINASYWDSMKKGLLAGETLQFDLRTMESSYIDANKRVLELTKHVSLALLNAEALIELRTTGSCNITIPEALYDLDYPNHFNRKIKSLSISIPCVAGPYTSVPCTVSHLGSLIRKNYTSTQFDTITSIPCGVIATSGAQNDNGVFDFSFRDERYLPFEGAGAICKLNLTLGGIEGEDEYSLRPFDFNTISDVVLHVKYTAQIGSSTDWDRSSDVLDNIEGALLGTYPGDSEGVQLPRIFSLKHEFPNEWYKYSSEIVTGAPMEINLRHAHFPAFCKKNNIVIENLYFALRLKDTTSPGMEVNVEGNGTEFTAEGVTRAVTPITSGVSYTIDISESPATTLNLLFMAGETTPEMFDLNELLEDIYMVAIYKLEPHSFE